MNFNQLLIWFVLSVGVMTVLQAYLRKDEALKAWVPTHFGVGVATLLAIWIMPDDAGYFGLAVYLLLVGVPLHIHRKLSQLAMQQRFPELLDQLPKLMWMHPQRHYWQELGEVWEAVANAQLGRLTQARWQLRELSALPGIQGATAAAWRYSLSGDWEAAREWFEQELELDLKDHPQLWVLYLRCLGETGDLTAMLDSHADFVNKISPYDRYNQQYARLVVLAFCGRADLVPLLFRGPLRFLPWQVERFWLATAHQAAGAHSTARHLLGSLQLLPDLLQQANIVRRLLRPTAPPSPQLQPRHWEHLARLERALDHQLAEQAQLALKPGAYGVLRMLISVNVLMYVVETLQGGSYNQYALHRLGALVTEDVLAGQWWRTITSTFLHQGFMHLAVNMLGLYIVGMLVISVVGKWRFLAIYFGAGTGGMATVAIINILRGEPQMVVGASAGVMGLLAATAVITWRHWREGRQPETRLRLILLVAVLILQACLDATSPEVSSLAHMSGAFFGALLALLFRQPALLETAAHGKAPTLPQVPPEPQPDSEQL